MTTDVQRPGVISTFLNYRNPENGDNIYAGTVGELRKKHAATKVNINDVRHSEESITLDKQGFQVVNHESSEKEFDNEDQIKRVYYPECAELLKKHTNATKVIPFAHVVRRQDQRQILDSGKDLEDTDRTPAPGYAGFVHIDQSYKGAYTRISGALPEYADKLGNQRFAIMNIWRPIHYPVTRDALAVCDARSVPESHLHEQTIRFPKEARRNSGSGQDAYAPKPPVEAWAVEPPSSPDEHKWWYVSEMKPEEAFLLKIFDFKIEDGLARRAPHTAFSCEEDYGLSRHSIECRCLVLWDD
ncbi:Hydroxylase/desaturase asaB [Pseudocercospora fuligena]|uniref:Hydroxylase/desaturase asaB n=1 Tax=Pseudocercospora fuligena TaxID=685502 RepID=A0A8H6R8Q0_9PEZI|nr:Hydroxylase/desaturase asaB [Pseudocercospora fuligena]